MNYQMDPFFSNHQIEHVYDSLTGVINKDYLLKYASRLIEKNTLFTLYFIDFDNFKKVNDVKGHLVGDRLLKETCEVLKKVIGDKGLLFRYGGDEFVALFPNLATYEDVWNQARDMSEAVRKMKAPYLDEEFISSYPLSLTMGISRYPIDGKTLDILIDDADKALYRGKMKGKNCFIIYNRNLHGLIDVHKKKSDLTIHGLVDYIYDMFLTHEKIEAMGMIAHMLGNYFSEKGVYLLTPKEKIPLYVEKNHKNISLPRLGSEAYRFEENENFSIYYRSVLSKADPMGFLPLMDARKIKSFVVFKIQTPQPSVLLLESERENVWSENEILLYLSMVHVYELLERCDFHLKNKK